MQIADALTVQGALTATGGVNGGSGNILSGTPQLLSAAGSTQGAATKITSSIACLTVCTASARGLALTTGLSLVLLTSFTTQGCKVYPEPGSRIESSATNAALVIAGFKGSVYVRKDARTWGLIKGS
jgi:hypothetical protein